METTQAKIENVFVKPLNDGRSLYRTITAEREYTTFKKDLAEAAKQLIDQQAEIGYTFKPGNPREGGGTWPANYYLESVTPAAMSNGGGGGFSQGPPDDREIRIMREAALERALLTLPYFEKAEQTRETLATLCEEYFSYFATGNWESVGSMTATAPDDDIPF